MNSNGKLLAIAGAALAAVLLLATLAGGGLFVAYRVQLAQNEEPIRTDQRPREELVIDLPEDAGKWALTVIYEGTKDGFTARDNALRAAFASEPRIKSLTVQCHQNAYYSDHPLWLEKYRETMGPALPQIWLQDADGHVVFKASGDNIPYHPSQLADELQDSIAAVTPVSQFNANAENCPGLNCPPNYRPSPDSSNFRPRPDSRFIPDIRPQISGPLRPSSGSTVWVVVGVLLVGSVVAAAVLAVLVGLAIVAAARR